MGVGENAQAAFYSLTPFTPSLPHSVGPSLMPDGAVAMEDGAVAASQVTGCR